MYRAKGAVDPWVPGSLAGPSHSVRGHKLIIRVRRSRSMLEEFGGPGEGVRRHPLGPFMLPGFVWHLCLPSLHCGVDLLIEHTHSQRHDISRVETDSHRHPCFVRTVQNLYRLTALP